MDSRGTVVSSRHYSRVTQGSLREHRYIYWVTTQTRIRPYQCVLRLDRSAPSIATLSCVFADLTRKGIGQRLFEDLVTQCQKSEIIHGTHVAMDSTASHAYEKKEPKRKKRAYRQCQLRSQTRYGWQQSEVVRL